MRVMIIAVVVLLTACQHAPVRCDRHLVPINPVTRAHSVSPSRVPAVRP